MIGGWQWVIILVVVLLLFGTRIPGIARSLGSGITEFRRGLKDGTDKQQLPGDDGVDKSPDAARDERLSKSAEK